MSFTPRRSTRGQIFTPSPHPSTSTVPKNVSFRWTSSPLGPSDSLPPSLDPDGVRTYYNSFTRVTTSAKKRDEVPLNPAGKKKKKGEEEARFTIGDGVLVKVEGGVDGVGVLIRLWEEPEPEDEEDEEGEEGDEEELEGREGGGGGREKAENGGQEGEGVGGRRMMGEVHWCFRRQDLPGIMKNLSVKDNEVLLATSPTRPVTTTLPVALLLKTLPIYSLPFFKSQFEPTKSVVKGWEYVRTGVYFCAKAFDKSAKGGKVHSVDIDEWREGGKRGLGWDVKVAIGVPEEKSETEASSDDDVGSVASARHGSDDDIPAVPGEEAGKPTKRKRAATAKSSRPAKKSKTTKQRTATPQAAPGASRKTLKGKKLPHPKSSTSHLPLSILSPDQLPQDPYERALRLLHVGATPESLPCREEEFVDVLSRVEEGVETGGGGCLYIAGVPGTGKTATVHAVVKELKRKAEDGELPPFSYVEINGLKIPSPQHAYTVLWEAISGAKGVSTKTALRGLESHFGRKTAGVRGPRSNTFVVLMDELDQLLTAKQDVVYNFFNWPTMRDSQLYVIAVANRMDLPQHLAAKIKSRLGLQTILFQPYDRQSLIEIVQSRLIPHPQNKAEHKVLQPDAIALAATKMAGTNGDARRVLDACRRAVEVAIEPKEGREGGSSTPPHPVTAKEMMSVLNLMSSSPVALFLKQCSLQQKMMLASVVRCVRREGIPEIPWRAVRTDHDALTRSLVDSNDLLSSAELAIVFSSLLATHALTWAYDLKQSYDDRKVALGMEIGEVGRILMNEGEAWRRALAGT